MGCKLNTLTITFDEESPGLFALLPARIGNSPYRTLPLPDYNTLLISPQELSSRSTSSETKIQGTSTEPMIKVLLVRGATSPVEDARRAFPTGAKMVLILQLWLDENAIKVGCICFSGSFTTRR
jgi:hypothetical protein